MPARPSEISIFGRDPSPGRSVVGTQLLVIADSASCLHGSMVVAMLGWLHAGFNKLCELLQPEV
jgi:hypothetical protein